MSTGNKNIEYGHRVVLSTKKVVVLRDPQVGDQELAAEAIGGKAEDKKFLFVMLLNQELVKHLLVSIDGKALTAMEKERIKEHLSLKEFNQITKVIGKLTGSEEEADPLIETVSFGKP